MSTMVAVVASALLPVTRGVGGATLPGDRGCHYHVIAVPYRGKRKEAVSMMLEEKSDSLDPGLREIQRMRGAGLPFPVDHDWRYG